MSHDASGVAFYEYVGHHSLIDLTILDDETEGDEEDLAASTGVVGARNASSTDRHAVAIVWCLGLAK